MIMDEFNQGMDPAVKKYFRKIVNSFVAGLVWLMTMAMSGIYYQLAVVQGELRWYNILFYTVFVVTLIWLIRYFYRSWKAPTGIMEDDKDEPSGIDSSSR